MTATTLQTIRNALRTAVASLDVMVNEIDVTAKRPSRDGQMAMQVALAGVSEQARTSTRILEQVLVDVTLSAPQPKIDQDNRDDLHALAEQIRDICVGVTATGMRVEQLVSPNPLDAPAALQGLYQHRFQLDWDVLRTLATVAPPTVTDTGDDMPILTKARGAVWDAINNWAPFAADDPVPAAWTRKYQSPEDLEELSLHDPGHVDLPAIAVTWGPTATEWWVNTMQKWSQQLFVTFWLPANWEQVAEWRLMQLTQALYQSAPVDSTVSYIRRATGRPPAKNSPLSLELVALGRSQSLHAWRGTIALDLTANFDPNA